MSIPVNQARIVLEGFQTPQILNLFAQAHAKYVLHEVRESIDNFPPFDPNLAEKVTLAAYSILAAGCSLAEQGETQSAIIHLERAASLLHNVHIPIHAESRESTFHVLVAAMAFYASSQYSRSFVTIRAIEEQTAASRAIAAFLRRDLNVLIQRINDILLSETPPIEDQIDLDEWAITVAIARGLSLVVEFISTGDIKSLEKADEQLSDALIVASMGYHPSWWWMLRLLRLMIRDLGISSPWTVLPPLVGPNNKVTLDRFVRLLAFARPPVIELWQSQLAALPLALDSRNRGAVINLRTSSGKTRVAELAILKTLLVDPSSRIFYLAPFRSLALEIESALSSTFKWLGFTVSHLYGGSRVSTVDTELASESSITIATPEKARALYRAAPELFQNLQLLIIDEGHLIGATERYVRNEMFVDHLRTMAQHTKARVLLMSAVLPNPQELADWIAGDANSVASSTWKPSAERFGLLKWNGSRVRIEWKTEIPSFNPAFIVSKPLGHGTRRLPFPNSKNEAVAATAVRLSAIGPVMVFVGRAVSVPTMAKAVLLALDEYPVDFRWPEHEWGVFKAVCEEELEPDAIEIQAARLGIVCHSNRLSTQVRLAIEHLMRARPPRIIIATTTLAQGVNVGISTVIIASPYIDAKVTIDRQDFWNICGRAGRAFVDGEGKILYAIDETRKSWQIQKDEELAQYYFNTTKSDRVESGLLRVASIFRQVADNAKVPFEDLLIRVAENDFSSFGSESGRLDYLGDLLDDELLAFHIDPTINHTSDDNPSAWVDTVFRNSLAAIQARSANASVSVDQLIGLLVARAKSAITRTPLQKRRSIVSSGLPLSVALRASESIDLFSKLAEAYRCSNDTITALVDTLQQIEEWARMYAETITGTMPSMDHLSAIREGWLKGIGFRALTRLDEHAGKICRDVYGYQMPWIIHAVTQQLRNDGRVEDADTMAKIALLVEIGVPNERAARMFLAGVRSRMAATELSSFDVFGESGVSAIAKMLSESEIVEALRPLVSESTSVWLDLFIADAGRGRIEKPEFMPFTLEEARVEDTLYARELNGMIHLCSVNGQSVGRVDSTDEYPFVRVANDARYVFQKMDNEWSLHIRDPRH